MDQDLPPHEIHKNTGIDQFDVFIAGSGPIGATYARLLTRHGYNVVMAEIGDQETRVPAAHKKNEIDYQKDIDRFVRVIQGALSAVSVPPSSTVVPELDPSAWRPTNESQMTITNGRNPYQKTHNNLPAEAVTRCVGGMSTHWTCATPEFLKGEERPKIFPDSETADDDEWKLLYEAARSLIGTSSTQFEESIRHNTVLETLKKAFPERGIKPLPLACNRLAKGSPYVRWHAADHVYYDIFDQNLFGKPNSENINRGKFFLLTNTRCTRLHNTTGSAKENVHVGVAEVMDLLADGFSGTTQHKPVNFAINAKVYVVAAGAVATPQILANSGFGGIRGQTEELIPALGKHITEQPLAFCQIILNQHIVENIGSLHDKPQWWKDAVNAHMNAHPEDPLPIPFQDPEPQVNIPVTEDFPWHAQIHRDAFSYGEAGPRADSRVVVDLRFFARQAGDLNNRIVFEEGVTDVYGMPQATFEYTPTTQFADEAGRMMKDMTDVANALGGYLPGSEPQFMAPGLALHLGGTVRLGQGKDQASSVANFNSQVWNFRNLYVGGNGVIPTAFAANPTLTSIALALRATRQIVNALRADPTGENLKAAVPDEKMERTPREYLKWLTDKTDVDHPDHKRLRTPHREVIINPE
ncbi:putative pyranose oxidase [Irpex rosettiformis]|uniref:Pyranose oxidase n=1 Tax=Irpex rosettiformis TaxID=378272 RepID=A0ACB8TSG5_9APHY|nr:putative pyranose oxidase [Irpex rosettiformis]